MVTSMIVITTSGNHETLTANRGFISPDIWQTFVSELRDNRLQQTKMMTKLSVLLLCFVWYDQLLQVQGHCDAKLESALFDDLIHMMSRLKGTSLGHSRYRSMHNVPAFTAYRKTSQSLSSGSYVVFDHVWTNNQNGYNKANGIFTAPVAGLYHFGAVLMAPSSKSLFLRLYHNNTKITSSFSTSTGYKTGSFDTVLQLQKGDTVYIKSGHNSQQLHSDSDHYSTFSGYLIASN